jgi:hypothetical protein
MDPLSLTASLIAVLQISGSVISSLYAYRNSVKTAAKEAARIIDEVNSLRGVLEGLLQAVGGGEDHGDDDDREDSGREAGAARLRTFQQLAAPGGELDRCRADLEALQTQLGVAEDGRQKNVVTDSGAARWKALKQALLWPLKEADVRYVLENLQRAKGTLGLALAADQAVLTMEIQEGVWALSRDFAAMELGEDLFPDCLTFYFYLFSWFCKAMGFGCYWKGEEFSLSTVLTVGRSSALETARMARSARYIPKP